MKFGPVSCFLLLVSLPLMAVFCRVSATFHGKKYSKSLVSVERVSSFWSFLESLLEELGACENFLSSQPLSGPCPKCLRHRLPSVSPLSAPPSQGE